MSRLILFVHRTTENLAVFLQLAIQKLFRMTSECWGIVY